MAPRLLLVDAPSGPPPQVYLPLLPPEVEVRVVALLLGRRQASEERLATFRGRGLRVDAVEDRARLPEIVRDAAESWQADGILALSERVVHEASLAAYSLGLPANPPETQQALRDKAHQRRLLRAGGVAVPRFARIDTRADLEAAARDVGFPAVLKPTVGSASLAVFGVRSETELRAGYDEAAEIYARDPRQHARPTFVLEERLQSASWHPDPRIGDFVSVESLVTPRGAVHLMVTDKFPLAEPFRERGEILPSTLPQDAQALFREEAGRAIAALGMRVGAVHTEIKMTPHGPRVIEVNGRIGGGIAELLSLVFGYNVIRELVHLVLGGEEVTPLPPGPGYGAYYLPQFPFHPCRVTRLPAPEELAALPSVRWAELLLALGAEPDWRRGTYDCAAKVFAASPSWDELMRLADTLFGDAVFGFEPL